MARFAQEYFEDVTFTDEVVAAGCSFVRCRFAADVSLSNCDVDSCSFQRSSFVFCRVSSSRFAFAARIGRHCAFDRASDCEASNAPAAL